jgi:hypothetical protein
VIQVLMVARSSRSRASSRATSCTRRRDQGHGRDELRRQLEGAPAAPAKTPHEEAPKSDDASSELERQLKQQ